MWFYDKCILLFNPNKAMIIICRFDSLDKILCLCNTDINKPKIPR